MFSLSDEISKFQKQILSFPEGVLSIDDRFLGGGIKMQDLIRENSFIINEMKKFRQVFINYCKLNDRIYKKIIEHEIHSGEHLGKIMGVSSHFEKKFQQTDKEIRMLREQLEQKIQFIKGKNEKQVDDIRYSINRKVDQEGFAEKITKIIKIYDEDPELLQGVQQTLQTKHIPLNPNQSHPIQNHQKSINNVENSFKMTEETPKETKVTQKFQRNSKQSQSMSRLKAQIQQLMQQISEKLQKVSSKSIENQTKIQQTSNDFTVFKGNYSQFIEQFQHVKINFRRFQDITKEQNKKIYEFVSNQISEQIWKQKFQDFKKIQIQGVLLQLKNQLCTKISTLQEKIVLEIEPSLQTLSKNDLVFSEDLKLLRNEHEVSIQRIQALKKNLQDQKNQILSENQQKVSKINEKIEDFHKISIKNHNSLTQTIKNIEMDLKGISGKIQANVYVKCQHRINKGLKDVLRDFGKFQKKVNQISEKSINFQQKIGYLKDLVAQKANFSDLVLFFDQKADKADIVELHDLVLESPKGSNSDKIIEDQNKNEGQIFRTRKKSLDKRNRFSQFKRNLSPVSVSKAEPDESGSGNGNRIFHKLIANTEVVRKNANKVSYRNHSFINKTIRPSTATTLFLF